MAAEETSPDLFSTLLREMSTFVGEEIMDLNHAKQKLGEKALLLARQEDMSVEDVYEFDPSINFLLGKIVMAETIVDRLQAVVLPHAVEASMDQLTGGSAEDTPQA